MYVKEKTMAKKEEKIEYKDSRGELFQATTKKGVWDEAESKGRPLKELDYYNCPFSTDLELEDFSKEFLIKLMRTWEQWYISMALLWWAAIGEKCGQEAANELLPEVWEKLAQQGMPMYVPLLGPKYKTVDDLKTLKDRGLNPRSIKTTFSCLGVFFSFLEEEDIIESFERGEWESVKNLQERLQTANLDKLAKLITVTALLLQTKIYLFWRGTPEKTRSQHR
jgi:hypothetical protein